MTPLDLITQALKKTGVLGVGQTPQAEDVNDAFLDLNMMLGQWNRKRWLIYHLVDKAVEATGANGYRIGPGLDIDVPGRVVGIEAAYFRFNRPGQPDTAPDFSEAFSPDFGPQIRHSQLGVDVPLDVIRSREDYSRIGVKGVSGFPGAVYLDAGSSSGVLYVVPSPSYGEIHVVVQDTLAAFPDLTKDIELPAEYAEALLYNLSCRLRASYQKPPDMTMVGLARASLSTIKVANAQIGTLTLDPFLTSRARGGDWGGFGAVAFASTPATTPTVPPAFVVIGGGREGGQSDPVFSGDTLIVGGGREG